MLSYVLCIPATQLKNISLVILMSFVYLLLLDKDSYHMYLLSSPIGRKQASFVDCPVIKTWYFILCFTNPVIKTKSFIFCFINQTGKVKSLSFVHRFQQKPESSLQYNNSVKEPKLHLSYSMPNLMKGLGSYPL